jgi:hypoxanthine phosphoribosyltransferase
VGVDAVVDEAQAVFDNATELFTAAQVSAALERMSEEIAAVIQYENPVVLAVMRGGVFTATELCSRLRFPYHFDFVHVGRYGNNLSGGELIWSVRPSANLSGRSVLIVDDILDRGITLRALHEELIKLDVAATYTAVLVEKTFDVELQRPPVDFVGLRVDDNYVFGCGMDYKGYWRGLPSLFSVAS